MAIISFAIAMEKRTRKQANPPQWNQSLGTRYLAPSDGDCGGSWIAVNHQCEASLEEPLRFHHRHSAGPSAHSVCMHRPPRL